MFTNVVAVAIAALAFKPLGVFADSNGMDMSMDGPMDLASGRMLPYLHFSLGDMLWFQGWVPQSAGAMVGACIGLFLLALVERWVATMRSVMEAHWRAKERILIANKIDRQRQTLPTSSLALPSSSGEKDEVADLAGLPELRRNVGTTASEPRLNVRHAAPFIASHDIPRGIIFAGQSALDYILMLAIMTYQVGFLFSVCIGLGVGEVLFGRYATLAHFH